MDDSCKTNDELEEGECSDQDDLGMSVSSSDFLKQPMNHSGVDTTNIYRREGIPQIIINSDQSQSEEDDSDEDDYYGKKTRRYSDFSDPHITPSSFVNPLRDSGKTESLTEESMRKRRNNVWGAVITEQMLSQNIKQFGVNTPVAGGNRDVESYDFTIAKEDTRPEVDIKTDNSERDDIFGGVVDLEREVKRHQNRKRKRNAKERLGAGVGHENRKLGKMNIAEGDDVHKVTKAITDALSENNVPLFTRIVDGIGNEKAIQLYNMTVDVESAGGMMINSGNRRRTPGGVYIQLLKSDNSIPAPVISVMFEEEQQLWIERKKYLRKIKTAARKKWKKSKRLDMDLDRPETPTPTEELEELDNSNEVEVDVSDVPDRPDTPEPKDSSDNESEVEDEEEEEDIAVAIAKAKAAILKKQNEMAESESKIEEDVNCDGMVNDNVEMS